MLRFNTHLPHNPVKFSEYRMFLGTIVPHAMIMITQTALILWIQHFSGWQTFSSRENYVHSGLWGFCPVWIRVVYWKSSQSPGRMCGLQYVLCLFSSVTVILSLLHPRAALWAWDLCSLRTGVWRLYTWVNALGHCQLDLYGLHICIFADSTH